MKCTFTKNLPASLIFFFNLFSCRLRVERANEDTNDDTGSNNGNNAGRNLKVEALTTVRQLERFLAKYFARQWYDMDRSTFTFVQKIKAEAPITFAYDVSIKWIKS